MAGIRKPDAGIYQLALSRFGAAAENTFFTDDSSGNVAGAAAVGIHAHRIAWVDGVPQVGDL